MIKIKLLNLDLNYILNMSNPQTVSVHGRRSLKFFERNPNAFNLIVSHFDASLKNLSLLFIENNITNYGVPYSPSSISNFRKFLVDVVNYNESKSNNINAKK